MQGKKILSLRARKIHELTKLRFDPSEEAKITSVSHIKRDLNDRGLSQPIPYRSALFPTR
jgi:hypothetical protein